MSEQVLHSLGISKSVPGAAAGKRVIRTKGKPAPARSPIDGATLATVTWATKEDVDAVVQAANEAFNTSGGVGTLCETLAGKVRTLNYKTIRYRGHRDLMAFLMNELRLNDRRAILKDILESSVPMTPQDVVLIFCTVMGWKDGRFMQLTDARKIYHGDFLGQNASAIQITTAASLCAVVDLHAQDRLPNKGFVRQEQVELNDFLSNRFGKAYESDAQDVAERVSARSGVSVK